MLKINDPCFLSEKNNLASIVYNTVQKALEEVSQFLKKKRLSLEQIINSTIDFWKLTPTNEELYNYYDIIHNFGVFSNMLIEKILNYGVLEKIISHTNPNIKIRNIKIEDLSHGEYSEYPGRDTDVIIEVYSETGRLDTETIEHVSECLNSLILYALFTNLSNYSFIDNRLNKQIIKRYMQLIELHIKYV